jgi:hypothetical protein
MLLHTLGDATASLLKPRRLDLLPWGLLFRFQNLEACLILILLSISALIRSNMLLAFRQPTKTKAP